VSERPLAELLKSAAIEDCLVRWPAFRPRAGSEGDLVLEGRFGFRAVYQGVELTGEFSLRIEIPRLFPAELPLVFEIGGRIPRTWHRNLDSSLCLGAPIALHQVLHASPDLETFLEGCLVPYLYQFRVKERGGQLPLGDLPHGELGILSYYRDALLMPDIRAALASIRLLGMPRDIAALELCPCGSGRVLAHCHSFFLDRLREVCSPSWFRRRYAELLNAVVREADNL